jgi:hypothetical protein
MRHSALPADVLVGKQEGLMTGKAGRRQKAAGYLLIRRRVASRLGFLFTKQKRLPADVLVGKLKKDVSFARFAGARSAK